MPRHRPPAPRPRSSSRAATQAGQATLEYTALLAIVLAVLVAGGATLAVAPGVVNGVGRGVRQALCVVTGDTECAAAERVACVVRSKDTAGSLVAKVALLRLGGGLTLLRSERSDGSVELTFLTGGEAGLEAGLGVKGSLSVKGVPVAHGAEASAQVVARLGGGRTWVVPDAAAADRLQQDLVRNAVAAVPVAGDRVAAALFGPAGRVPPADSTITQGGLAGSADAAARAGAAESVAAQVEGEALLGRRVDRATGRRTWFFTVAGAAAGSVSDVERGAADAGIRRTRTVAATYEADGTPVSLVVVGAGGENAAFTPPDAAKQDGADPDTDADPGSTASRELTRTLDLRDAENRAVAERYLRSLRPGGVRDHGAAADALEARMATEAALELRRYGVDARTTGVAGEVGAGGKFGLEATLVETTATLREAWSRPPHGAWESRLDCLAAA